CGDPQYGAGILHVSPRHHSCRATTARRLIRSHYRINKGFTGYRWSRNSSKSSLLFVDKNKWSNIIQPSIGYGALP
ncbi:MAG: hypothetical protein PVH94_09240, partial [Desulfobacterales bacterium]